MSDKAQWIKKAAERICRVQSCGNSECEPCQVLVSEIAEIIAEECTAQAPTQPRCGKNMGNDLLVIPCDLPRDHQGPCERNVWPVNEAGPQANDLTPEEAKGLAAGLMDFAAGRTRPFSDIEAELSAEATPQGTPWKSSFTHSDVTGNTHNYVDTGDGKRLWAEDADEIVKRHNAPQGRIRNAGLKVH